MSEQAKVPNSSEELPSGTHPDELVRDTRLGALAQISASLAHDLRNPLGAILNAAYLLKRRLAKLEPQALEFVEIIEDEVRNADAIIGALAEMSAGRDLRAEKLDLAEILDEAHARSHLPATVAVEKNLKPSPFPVFADRAQLRQVFQNLLSNAGQAMAGKGKIRVSAHRTDDACVIDFEDTGPGIPAEVRQRIFEPLFTTRPRAIGLGLTICRQILHRHGGEIELIGADGEGAHFRLTFRRAADGMKAS